MRHVGYKNCWPKIQFWFPATCPQKTLGSKLHVHLLFYMQNLQNKEICQQRSCWIKSRVKLMCSEVDFTWWYLACSIYCLIRMKICSNWDFEIPFSELNCSFAYICFSLLGFFLLTCLYLLFFSRLCAEESHNYMSIRFLLEWFFCLINAILLLVMMLSFRLPFDKAYWKSVCFIASQQKTR